MSYTLESANCHRVLAQHRLEGHYTELNRQEGLVKTFSKVAATSADPEQRKAAESKMRSASLHMTQLRDSYIPSTREAMSELDAEIRSFAAPVAVAPQSKVLPPDPEYTGEF